MALHGMLAKETVYLQTNGHDVKQPHW